METAPSQTRPFSQTEINWDKLDKTKFYVIGAGIFSAVTVALYPISVVKTRLQIVSKDSVERNAFSVTRGLLKAEGIPGLYKGFGTVITGAVPARIIFLTALETTKVAAFRMIEPLKLSEPTQAAIANGIAGMTASLFAQAVVVPIDVVSQRLMVQGYSGHASYSGGLDVARKVLKSDGIRGLYRGFSLSVMTYSPSSAVWWASYGSSQRVIWRFLGHGTESDEAPPSQLSIMLVQGAGGIFAGAAASCITTPLDTIKTRLQIMDDQCYQRPYEGITQTSSEEGLEKLQLQIANALRFSDNLECQSTQNAYCQERADFKLISYHPNCLGYPNSWDYSQEHYYDPNHASQYDYRSPPHYELTSRPNDSFSEYSTQEEENRLEELLADFIERNEVRMASQEAALHSLENHLGQLVNAITNPPQCHLGV